MSKIEKYLAAKADAETVKAELNDGAVKSVKIGAVTDGSTKATIEIECSFAVTPNTARCLAQAVEQNMAAILASVVANAEAKREQARIAARSEAQEVLLAVGP